MSQKTTTNSNLCEACHTKPKYVDGTKTHPYCGKTCAAKMKNMCDYCHKSPKYNDGQKTHPYCGKTCAQKAAAAGHGVVGGGGAAAPSGPVKNGCLLCGKAVRKGNFCSQACTSQADKKAPLLLEIDSGHDTFKSVAHQFTVTWKSGTCPAVRRVYKVILDPTLISKYEAYKAAIEARGNFVAARRSPGNENRRWHGTKRQCTLGDNGNTTLCSSTSCALCSILRTSYSMSKSHAGCFGTGIYTSATSSKSNGYSSNAASSKYKVMLLNKVVVGRGYKLTQMNSNLSAPPAGYDSILAEIAPDELICYNEDAVRPTYLLTYDA